MNRIDLTRTVLAPSGVELTAIDALQNALNYLIDSDADCAYVQAARALLGAVLSGIRQQAEPEVQA